MTNFILQNLCFWSSVHYICILIFLSVFQVSSWDVLSLPLQWSTQEGSQTKKELKVAKRALDLAEL